MTRLCNDRDKFADEAAAGFARAFAPWVRRVPGGVVQQSPDGEPTVALVIGGGSGHYPAFAGLVGKGLAHGAVMGNLFASPSARQVYDVVRAAERGRGVLLSYGNYAGDVLHFDQAQERLRSEGIRCETVVVTDDISSAPPEELDRRRGIAGDLVVFKAAGAACAAGYSLDDVARVARTANNRTRTLGVAFSGCTLPGASEPLFTVPAGRMAVGMGIHGEPGIDEADIPTARELATLLVEKLLAERPDGGSSRVVAILNGLGSVKYEELFVLYNDVSDRLDTAGLHVVAPEVGELVTSFDMAGVSLTLCWLDDELERLWCAPADAPAFRKITPYVEHVASPIGAATSDDEKRTRTASADGRAAGCTVLSLFRAAARAIDADVVELGRLDAIAGDGDHGIGMQRGSHAAAEAAERTVSDGGGAATVLREAADAWEDRAGGTSGALWGVGLRKLAESIDDEAIPEKSQLAVGISAAVGEIMRLGKASPGDKTMVDVLVPFCDAFVAADGETLAALRAAVPVAEKAAIATADLLPRIGRARPHAEKSLGIPDPGARSLALVLRAVLDECEAAQAKEEQ